MSKLTRDRVDKILKTLPIGYYLGKNYSVELTDRDGTSCDIMNEKIYISYPQIEKYFNVDLDDEALESRIRGLLYHELSHAMLTPRTMKPNFAKNVVEDCRIEEVCKDYYLGVDFIQLRKEMMIDTPNADKQNAFIRFCKLREGGTSELLRKLDDLIYKYRKLNALSDSWNTDPSYYYYECGIGDIYSEFCDWFNQNAPQTEQESDNNENDLDGDQEGFGSGASGMSDEEGDGNSSSEGEGEEGEADEEDANGGTAAASEGDDREEGEAAEAEIPDSGRSSMHGILPQFEAVNEAYMNKDLISQFMQVFTMSSKREKANSSAVHGYSGVFDSRSAGRDDYKFFLQKNRQGTARAYSKVHLNLFLDRSGSFESNVTLANQIIYALAQCERISPEFDFTLITCGDGEDIMDKNNRTHSAWDGTSISHKIFETFKKVQKRDAVNYNVVLYDGRAYNYYARKGEDGAIENFRAFDTSNTVMILDNDNRKVKDICKAAKIIISRDYTDELIKNLLDGLKVIFR